MISPSAYIELFKTVGKSKRLLRAGWVREKVKDSESVAEHSFRVAMMAMVLSTKLDYDIDEAKLVKMALLHDLGEVVTGDMVIERGVFIDVNARQGKEEKERDGINKIFSLIGDEDEYVAIFQEMMNRTSKEAILFWQLDKLEMALQAHEYASEQKKDLKEFILNADLSIKEPVLRKILDLLKKRGKRKTK